MSNHKPEIVITKDTSGITYGYEIIHKNNTILTGDGYPTITDTFLELYELNTILTKALQNISWEEDNE